MTTTLAAASRSPDRRQPAATRFASTSRTPSSIRGAFTRTRVDRRIRQFWGHAGWQICNSRSKSVTAPALVYHASIRSNTIPWLFRMSTTRDAAHAKVGDRPRCGLGARGLRSRRRRTDHRPRTARSHCPRAAECAAAATARLFAGGCAHRRFLLLSQRRTRGTLGFERLRQPFEREERLLYLAAAGGVAAVGLGQQRPQLPRQWRSAPLCERGRRQPDQLQLRDQRPPRYPPRRVFERRHGLPKRP